MGGKRLNLSQNQTFNPGWQVVRSRKDSDCRVGKCGRPKFVQSANPALGRGGRGSVKVDGLGTWVANLPEAVGEALLGVAAR